MATKGKDKAGPPARAEGKKRKGTPVTVCDQLRQAINDSGLTHYRIGKDAGVKPEVVARFVRGERDVRGETFAKIALALGMELVKKEERGPG